MKKTVFVLLAALAAAGGLFGFLDDFGGQLQRVAHPQRAVAGAQEHPERNVADVVGSE